MALTDRVCIHTARGAAAIQAMDGVLHLLCWSASVAFRPVAKRAASVLLTSGTLHPMHLLQTEFFGSSAFVLFSEPFVSLCSSSLIFGTAPDTQPAALLPPTPQTAAADSEALSA